MCPKDNGVALSAYKNYRTKDRPVVASRKWINLYDYIKWINVYSFVKFKIAVILY